MIPRPLRWSVTGTVPEGTANVFNAETGSGPEGSSLTANDPRLEALGVESSIGLLVMVPVHASDRSVPARQRVIFTEFSLL
jgi:hypothetical protein